MTITNEYVPFGGSNKVPCVEPNCCSQDRGGTPNAEWLFEALRLGTQSETLQRFLQCREFGTDGSICYGSGSKDLGCIVLFLNDVVDNNKRFTQNRTRFFQQHRRRELQATRFCPPK